MLRLLRFVQGDIDLTQQIRLIVFDGIQAQQECSNVLLVLQKCRHFVASVDVLTVRQ